MSLEDFLSESKRLWKFLVENTLDLICVTDNAGIIRYATPSHLDTLGFTPRELIGTSFFSLVHPEDLDMAVSRFAEGMGERKNVNAFGRYRHRGGHYLWIEATGIPLIGDGGDLLGGIVISRDVTERVETEEILRSQRDLAVNLARVESLEEALEISLDAILDISGFEAGGAYLLDEANGDLDLVCSRGMSELYIAKSFHYDADHPYTHLATAREPAYRRIDDIPLAPDDFLKKESFKAVATVPLLHQGQVIGTFFIASRSFDDVPEPARNVLEAIGGLIGQMITRERLNQALRESEAEYRAVFEATGTAMCLVDREGRVIFTNHEFLWLSGYGAEEVEEGLFLRGFLKGEGVEDILLALREPLSLESLPHFHVSYRLSCAGGGTREVLVSIGVLPRREAAVLSLIDVTREWEYGRQLEERARQLADFLGVASHELRHPVTLIRGYAETMLEMWKDGHGETSEEIVVAVETSSYRLMHLVEELLDVTRIESGRFPTQMREESLVFLVREVMEEMRERYTKWDFELRVGGEPPPATVDPERIRQLLVILLENAANFSRPGQAIEVELGMADGCVEVSVLDRGVGVPAGLEDRIFERFYQVEGLIHHSTPGLGLGLFIAASIVEAHGGRIWCEPRQGGGSTFRFTLPVRTPVESRIESSPFRE